MLLFLIVNEKHLFKLKHVHETHSRNKVVYMKYVVYGMYCKA